MKKILLILFFTIFLNGCSDYEYTPPPASKYRIGAIVYLKPDSTKCVIANKYMMGNGSYKYLLRYTDNNGVTHETQEKGKWNTITDNMLY